MKSKELFVEIKTNILSLGNEIKDVGKDGKFKEWLNTMSKFHNYSFYNTFSILIHRPEATMCMGFRKWKELDRYVKAGEHGLPILFPFKKKAGEKTLNIETGEWEEGQEYVSGFGVGHVFDISQTEGKPLPEINMELHGNDNGLLQRLEKIYKKEEIKLNYKELGYGHYGTSYKGEVDITTKADSLHQFKTGVHELAHERLHQNRGVGEKKVKEAEAEAVAYVVLKHFGFDPNSSATYLAIYDVEYQTLKDRLRTIQTTASKIIKELEE